jgi:tetratricopeptide (TPR) repeat protein
VETLWLDTLKKNPDSVLAHGEIGRMLFKQGKFNEAQFHFEQKIKAASYMKTIFPFKYALFLDDYGVVLNSMGKLDEAIVCYQNSLDVWEHFAGAHFTLGLALAQKGNVELARFHFLRALEIIQDKKDAQLNQRLCPQLNLNQFNNGIHRHLDLLEEKK